MDSGGEATRHDAGEGHGLAGATPRRGAVTAHVALPDPKPAAAAGGRRPLRRARPLRRLFDRLIARSSLVPNDPVLDVRRFPWTQALRENWQAIRDEACAAARAPVGPGRSFTLHGHGHCVQQNRDRCPATARLVAAIPGLDSACFSLLAPGAHIPAHRGVTKGLITCHLGLVVPRDGDARMRLGDRVVRWAEGETLVFDDSYDHEVWNDTGGSRLVLLIRFRRPLKQPGKWLADRFLARLRGDRLVVRQF